jgi:hypothetical protein
LTGGVNFTADFLGLGLVELTVIALLQFFLQVKNFVLESQLVDLVLGLERKNLVVSVLTESGSVVALQIHFLDFINSFTDLTTVNFINAHLVAELLAPDVDIVTENLVLGLEVVVFLESGLASVFQEFYLVLVLTHLGGCGSDSFELLVLLSQLIFEFLLSITQNHQVSEKNKRYKTKFREGFN